MTRAPSSPVEIQLTGHLTAAALHDLLKQASQSIPMRGQTALVIDCLGMTGYDSDARSLFVGWNSDHKKRISRVAVITEKVLWHVVVSAMSLASRQRIKAFHARDEGLSWAADAADDAPSRPSRV